MIQGAIFDMDGVLLHNVDYHLEAFRLFGEEQGRVLTREEVFSVFGRKNVDMMQALLGRTLSEAEVERFEDRKETIYRELIGPSLEETVVSGLLPFMSALSEEGVLLAVASSGPKKNVDMVLDGLAIRDRFSAVVTGELVTNGKPDPEAFLLAAQRLGVEPGDCAVFEDSFAGVRAGLASGGKCVAIATTHTEQELETLSPHIVVKDFNEISIGRLRRLWRPRG